MPQRIHRTGSAGPTTAKAFLQMTNAIGNAAIPPGATGGAVGVVGSGMNQNAAMGGPIMGPGLTTALSLGIPGIGNLTSPLATAAGAVTANALGAGMMNMTAIARQRVSMNPALAAAIGSGGIGPGGALGGYGYGRTASGGVAGGVMDATAFGVNHGLPGTNAVVTTGAVQNNQSADGAQPYDPILARATHVFFRSFLDDFKELSSDLNAMCDDLAGQKTGIEGMRSTLSTL